MRFDTDPDGELALGLEGGHSARRIVHAGGSETGRAITTRLAELVAAEPGIEVWRAPRRSRCGATASAAPAWSPTAARSPPPATVLTTGGGAALWRRTTNPWGAIGAGSVLAHAAGAELADLELCQFHPTALALPGAEHDGALITEAVRGEGATLLDAAGQRFTDELAPRDQVTAAILDRMARRRHRVRLARPAPASTAARFPNVFATCARRRARPRARAGAGRARRALPDRRRQLRPRRPHHASPACTRSASAPAPACTAPTGWPRTRSASASSSAPAPPAAAVAEPAAGEPPGAAGVALRAARAEHPRGASGAAPARGATPTGLERAARRPLPARAADRALGARRGASRAAPTGAPTSRSPTPRSTASTCRRSRRRGLRQNAGPRLAHPIGGALSHLIG